MPRIRTNFQSEAIYAGPSPATGYHWRAAGNDALTFPTTGQSRVNQIHRVQDASYSFALSKKDLNQFGQAGYVDRIMVDSPVVNLQFSYVQANFTNEKNLGFTICSGAPMTCVSGFLSNTTDERNYFVKDTSEGSDAINNTAGNYVVYGFGNCVLSSYTANGAVGDFPKASVGVQGVNVLIQSNSGEAIPAVNPQNGSPILGETFFLPYATGDAGLGPLAYSTLLPGDINLTLDYANLGVDCSDWMVENYALSINMNRTPIKELGTKFNVANPLQVPLNATLTINARVGDAVTGNLADVIKCAANGYTARISINKPACDQGVLTTDTGIAIQYEMRNCSLDSQSWNISVGGDKTVALAFTVPITGPESQSDGLYMSGIN